MGYSLDWGRRTGGQLGRETWTRGDSRGLENLSLRGGRSKEQNILLARLAGLAGTVVRLSTRLFVASSSAPRLPKHFTSPRKSEGVRCGLLQVYYLAASSSTSCRTTLP
jgi:hypothetical protein